MQIFKTKSDLSSSLSSLADSLIGFVPTMGALHNGHLELLRQAKKQCSVVVCSIFVNPTQFSNKEDINSYPNTLSDDITKLEKINCDVLYVPDVSDLYTIDEKTKHFNLNGLDNVMEGKFRKGHFDGVATIIEKFFNIIKPHKAYFGQKDLQQILVVKSLTKQLNLP
ncbi:MAG TPA: 4-phosphopantoate--beta-alanine ligase, partial [Flavobacteriales bacterium]|nr:4-phosphopantoate--beta-alanine ligase [Flavobacteriales bacterium]